jgi:hypothetical protein
MFKKEDKNSFWGEIGKRFHQKGLLDKSWELLIEMIRFDQEMFYDAYHILRKEYSEEKIFALREKDKQVNFMQVSVRENIEKHLLLCQKYRNDLSFSLGMATVVNHLERIGDNCKNSELSQVKAIVVSMYLRYLKRIDANQKNVATIMVNPFTQLGYKNMGENSE